MKKLLLCTVLLMPLTQSCIGPGNAPVKPFEEMSQTDYDKWKLYVELGVRIAAHRTVQQGIVTTEQLNSLATSIEIVVNEPVTTFGESVLEKALQNSGLSNDEIRLVVLIAENEIMSRGGYHVITDGGLIKLSPRTKEILLTVVSALKTPVSAPVTNG